MDTLFYLYGVVPGESPEPPELLRGVDGAAVSLLPVGAVAAVVSELPAAEYLGETLDAHLGDLAWVGERGLAHEGVLDWFMEHGPVVPLSLFSLHSSAERIRERFTPEAPRLGSLLESLRDRQEWGVKLWRQDETLREHIDTLSPSLRALAAEVEQASPGKRFLLAKKMETLRAEEIRSVSRRVAHQVYAMLQTSAERSVTVPLPPAAEGGRALLLHGAFLVHRDGFGDFQEAVTRVAHEFGEVGFELEFTGPWPPYHFVEQDGG